jgi:hypothetical protein
MAATLSPARTSYIFSRLALPHLPLLDVSNDTEAARQPVDMAMRGRIAHGLLVNYRISPQALAAFDLGPLDWDTHAGAAFLSVCLVRYAHLGPAWLPHVLHQRGSREVLYRLAVQGHHDGKLLRGSLSLLNQNSSRLVVAAGKRMGMHKFAHANVRIAVRRGILSVDAPGMRFAASLPSSHFAPPATSLFENLREAESYLLNLSGNIFMIPDGTTRLQPVLHSGGKATFLEPSETRFDLLEPWAGAGLLEYDSVLHIRNLRLSWARPHHLIP